MADIALNEDDFRALGAVFKRQQLAAALGEEQFGSDRDVYKVLGYTKTLTFSDYWAKYRRNDIAATVVDLPAEDTWRRPPPVTEDGSGETAFAEAWAELVRREKVFGKLSRADQLSGVGRFGVLLIGVKDGRELVQPVEDGALMGPKDVLYLRPFHEGDVQLAEWEDDHREPRYGMPSSYEIETGQDGTVEVHWTRVLHLAENKTTNEAYGTPRLQRIFNRLDDLLKLLGGTSEATWLNMRPGTAMVAKEGFEMPSEESFLKEMKRYRDDPLRIFRAFGMEPQDLGRPRVMDPTGAYKVQLGAIATATRIPQRILEGSAKGELSAAREDMRQWYGHVSDRQKNYAEPEILRPFVDRLIRFGALPEPRGGSDAYDVGTKTPDGDWTWPALYELDDLELAEVKETKARAAEALSNPMASYPLSLDERRELLGYEPREAEAGTVAEALTRARRNYREGRIDARQLAELVAGDGSG